MDLPDRSDVDEQVAKEQQSDRGLKERRIAVEREIAEKKVREGMSEEELQELRDKRRDLLDKELDDD